MIHFPSDILSHMRWHIPLDNSQYDDRHSLTDTHAAVAGFAAFLLKKADVKAHPEIVALAFWFRQANLVKISESIPFEGNGKKVKRVFHIAPANVDTVFMYSVLLSVLCANQNIVRVSQRSGEVTWLLVSLLREYLQTSEGQMLAPLISVVEYDAKHVSVTEKLSGWCDLRVLWGGDEAISAVSSIAPNTAQISFPDRYSVTLLQLNNNSNIKSIAEKFLTDLLPFTQQACSSPKAIYWLNTQPEYQQLFWKAVESRISQLTHHFETSHKVSQHILLQKLSAGLGLVLIQGTGSKPVSFAQVQNVGPIAHCKVKSLTAEILAAHDGNGLVIEKDIVSSGEIAFSSKLQTISYAVTGELTTPEGKFKRMVPLGKSLEFAQVWDGVDLLGEFW